MLMATAKAKASARKKKGQENKSEAIRQVLKEHGARTTTAKVREILAKKGIECHGSLVSQVKAKLRAKRRKTTTRKQTLRRSKPAVPTVRMDSLLAAKGFVEKCGSVDEATKALGIYAEVTG
jgi:hypothetical protein